MFGGQKGRTGRDGKISGKVEEVEEVTDAVDVETGVVEVLVEVATDAATESIVAEAAIDEEEVIVLGAAGAAVKGVGTVVGIFVCGEEELLAGTVNFGAGLWITFSLFVLV